jgi:integrase
MGGPEVEAFLSTLATALRVKDVDFERREITVRDGKGAKDRRTMLSERLLEPLRTHLAKVRALHEQDLAVGFGEVHLPFALARKYPKAGRSWPWQYVFPSGSRSIDPLDGVVRRRAGTAGALGRLDHHDLHACPQQGRPRRHQPARSPRARRAAVKCRFS